MASLPSQELASKEKTAFSNLFGLFHDKQYKKGIKLADTILAKNPDHGETLCMKALMLHHLSHENKDEAYELMKKGLTKNMTTHVCWHINGLIYRADKDYKEALKFYNQAHKRNEDDNNILRDLAHLQVHLRQLPPYIVSRHKIIIRSSQASQRFNWTGLAVAYHVSGQLEKAEKVLTIFEGILEDLPQRMPTKAGDYDRSELLMYHATILEEMGKHEEALAYLEQWNSEIVDRQAFAVFRAQLLVKVNRLESAEWAWTALLDQNPDSRENIYGYLQTKGIDLYKSSEKGEKEEAVKVLDSISQKFPETLTIKRLLLDLSTDDVFKSYLEPYLQNALIKGIPSLFTDLKGLYKDASKRQMIQEVVEGYRDNLEKSSTFDGSENSTTPPTTLLWTTYFLAQHYSFLSHHTRALDLISSAISHTPSLAELWMAKARIHKRAGDVIGAEEAMTEARTLDGQDRFLNSKAAKYLLRNGEVEEAERVAALFTRKDAPDPVSDLIDLQCVWFLQEEGDAYRRAGNYVMALKRYRQVEEMYDVIRDDEFDFHSYALRKFTLRVYVQLFRHEDQLHSHPGFFQAAKNTIEICLQLDENPITPEQAGSTPVADKQTNGDVKVNGEHAEPNGTAEEDKKKQSKKEKKAKIKAAKAAAADPKKAVAPAKKDEDELPPPPKDEDPQGLNLFSKISPKPLDEAKRLLKVLQEKADKRVETWLLSFDYAMRRKKYLEALKALRIAHALEPRNPELHFRIAQLKTEVECKFLYAFSIPPSTSLTQNRMTASGSLPQHVSAVINSAMPTLFPAPSIEAFNSDLLQHGSSLAINILAAAKALHIARGDSGRGEVEELVFQIVKGEVDPDVETTTQALLFLRSPPVSSSRAEEFRAKAAEKFPLADALKTDEELVKKREVRKGKKKSENPVNGIKDGDDAGVLDETGRERIEV